MLVTLAARMPPALGRTSAARPSLYRCMASQSSAGRSTSRWMGRAVLSGIVGTTACLGSWQLYRYTEKGYLVEERKMRLAEDPQPLFSVIGDPTRPIDTAAEFVPVTCEGVFLHDQQVLVGPRSAPPGTPQIGPPGAPQPAGYDVVTPLQCANGARILINRGWVPREATKEVSQPGGQVVIQGVLKHGDKSVRFVSNDVGKHRYIWLDLESLAESTNSSPILVSEAVGAAATRDELGLWPRPKPLDSYGTFHVTPSTHLIYTATWWSLAVFGSFMIKRFR